MLQGIHGWLVAWVWVYIRGIHSGEIATLDYQTEIDTYAYMFYYLVRFLFILVGVRNGNEIRASGTRTEMNMDNCPTTPATM
jgi:hypothetical protein